MTIIHCFIFLVTSVFALLYSNLLRCTIRRHASLSNEAQVKQQAPKYGVHIEDMAARRPVPGTGHSAPPYSVCMRRYQQITQFESEARLVQINPSELAQTSKVHPVVKLY